MAEQSVRVSATSDDGVLYLVISGELATSSVAVRALTQQLCGLFATYGATRVLIDSRALRNRMSITQVYELVRSAPQQVCVPSLTAMVDLPEHRPLYEFMETAFFNVGIRVRFFTADAPAQAWLTSASASSSDPPAT